ncbi:hypothetical protein N824_24865 [Pedobacter sp. V48]|nr:hypothetical protein N824_24865 [Pedobacter sp. V48]
MRMDKEGCMIIALIKYASNLIESLLDDKFDNKCFEKNFSFIKESHWVIGLVASKPFIHLSILLEEIPKG